MPISLGYDAIISNRIFLKVISYKKRLGIQKNLNRITDVNWRNRINKGGNPKSGHFIKNGL